MNILLCAYACEPHKGSEPEVGWQMVNEIAKIMPNDMVYVVTKYNNRELIEKEDYPKNIKFYYYAPPGWLTFWKKGGRGVRTYYYIWMLTATLFIRNKNINFDIVHHITFVNDWLPSMFYLLKTKNNKFIWGPIGSNAPIDKKFLIGDKRKRIEKIRIFLQRFFRYLDPSFYICKIKSDCIIGTTQNVKKNLCLSNNKCFIAESAIAIKKSDVLSTHVGEKNKSTFIIISVGKLIYIKNFQLTILSFSKFLKDNPSVKNVKLQIIGEGPDRESLFKLVKNLDIKQNIEFIGQVSRMQVLKHFSKANIFLFPTLESAGFVTLEAMSYSLPVLAMKYGGPEQFIKHNIENQLVSSDGNYDDIATALAKRLKLFYDDAELCNIVGKQNRQDVLDNFTWEEKAQKMKKLYMDILNEV